MNLIIQIEYLQICLLWFNYLTNMFYYDILEIDAFKHRSVALKQTITLKLTPEVLHLNTNNNNNNTIKNRI